MKLDHEILDHKEICKWERNSCGFEPIFSKEISLCFNLKTTENKDYKKWLHYRSIHYPHRRIFRLKHYNSYAFETLLSFTSHSSGVTIPHLELLTPRSPPILVKIPTELFLYSVLPVKPWLNITKEIDNFIFKHDAVHCISLFTITLKDTFYYQQKMTNIL